MRRNSNHLRSGHRWQNFHPALLLGQTLNVKAKREDPTKVFFRQSDIDGACGLHSLAMALVILRLAKSHALSQMASRRYGVPAEVWEEFGDDIYFSGVDPPEFVARVERLDLPLRISVRYANDPRLDRFAMENLRTGELVMVAFKSMKNRRLRHWALGVGAGGVNVERRCVTDTLLLLDPSAEEPEFSLFNARLVIKESRRTPRARAKRTTPITWQYDSAEWVAEPVRLIGAVRLR